MTRHRLLSAVLLLVSFVALTVTHVFPFLDGLSGVVESAIAVAGAACGVAGISLWFRKVPERPEA